VKGDASGEEHGEISVPLHASEAALRLGNGERHPSLNHLLLAPALYVPRHVGECEAFMFSLAFVVKNVRARRFGRFYRSTVSVSSGPSRRLIAGRSPLAIPLLWLEGHVDPLLGVIAGV
jgi:hypothetical protein